ncbi:hypothetical protein JI58_03225 [Marinosulfonomonas sp. PRT-SC04]|nr:hypothetical protein JI58_03225 [Marinosulfonomonas sp. PRT-SC04]
MPLLAACSNDAPHMKRFNQLPAQTRGILLMILAVFAFTILDLTAKSLSLRGCSEFRVTGLA